MFGKNLPGIGVKTRESGMRQRSNAQREGNFILSDLFPCRVDACRPAAFRPGAALRYRGVRTYDVRVRTEGATSENRERCVEKRVSILSLYCLFATISWAEGRPSNFRSVSYIPSPTYQQRVIQGAISLPDLGAMTFTCSAEASVILQVSMRNRYERPFGNWGQKGNGGVR